jgi:hypothetical protein
MAAEPGFIDLSEHYNTPDAQECFDHYRYMSVQCDAAREALTEPERLTADAYDRAARAWFAIYSSCAPGDLYDADPAPRRTPAEVVAGLRAEWKAACAADPRLDADFTDALIAQHFDAVLARQHLGHQETLRGNRLADGRNEGTPGRSRGPGRGPTIPPG